MKKWTKLDLSICKNERSKRSLKNEKGGQMYQKSRWKLVEKKSLLGPIIPKTNLETDFFSAERAQSARVEHISRS